MRPAVIYAAKSTEDVHESIPDQLEEAREMAAENDWTVVGRDFVDEGFSAYKGDRGPDLAAAMEAAATAAAETGEVCMLIAQAHDRFARGAGDAPGAPQHLVELWIAARRQNVWLRTVEDDYDMRDVQSVAAIGQRAMMDSRRKAKSVRKGMVRRVQRGLSPGGPRPYGYRYPGSGQPLVPVPAEVVIVRRIYSEFLAGRSQKAIATGLHEDRVPVIRGRYWRSSTVHGILTNVVYLGKVRYAGEVYDGGHEAVISPDVWERAADLLAAQPEKKAGRPPRGAHLFQGGLLRCECGEAMWTRTNGGYAIYYCGRRGSHGLDACDMPHLRRADIDGAVLTYFEQVALDVEGTRRALVAQHRRETDEIAELRKVAELQAARAAADLARVKSDYVAGDLTAAEWRELRADLEPGLEAATAEVERLKQREQSIEANADTIDAEQELLKQLADIRSAIVTDVRSAAGVDAVRAALRRLFSSFVVRRSLPSRVHVELLGVDDSGMWVDPVVRPEVVDRYAASGWPVLRKQPLHAPGEKSRDGFPLRDFLGFDQIPVTTGNRGRA